MANALVVINWTPGQECPTWPAALITANGEKAPGYSVIGALPMSGRRNTALVWCEVEEDALPVLSDRAIVPGFIEVQAIKDLNTTITAAQRTLIRDFLTATKGPTTVGDTTTLATTDDMITIMCREHGVDRVAHLEPARSTIRPVKAIYIAPNDISGLRGIGVGVNFSKKLLVIGAYSLWQIDAPADVARGIHNELYDLAPVQTLGALAIVKVFGTSFYPTAILTYSGMTVAQALARRNRIATYLDSLGKNTTALRAATTEHTQMLAIVVAMGYTAAQMWNAMTA